MQIINAYIKETLDMIREDYNSKVFSLHDKDDNLSNGLDHSR